MLQFPLISILVGKLIISIDLNDDQDRLSYPRHLSLNRALRCRMLVFS